MKRRVVVTGMGAVTSLGCKVDALWAAVCNGQSGIGPLERLDVSNYRVRFGGEVRNLSVNGYIQAKDIKRFDRFVQFAQVAGVDAVKDSGIDFAKYDPWRCGVILGSGIGGLETIEIQHERLLKKGPDKVSAFTIPKLIGNAASAELSILYGLRGPNQVVVTACASATNAIGDAYKLIRDDETDAIITGGSEAALTHIGLSAFAAMRALSERNDEPTCASRPFDRDRDGFVLSEGAGLLVIEELEHAKARGAPDFRRNLRLRRQRRRRAHHRPGQGRRRGRLRHDAGTQRRADQPLGHRLHQRPWHEHGPGRRRRDAGHQVGVPGPRQDGQHLQHQEPARPSARRQRRRGVDPQPPGHPRRPDPADDQLRDARPRLRSRLHAEPGPAAGHHGGDVEQLRLRRPQRLADRRQAAERVGSKLPEW